MSWHDAGPKGRSLWIPSLLIPPFVPAESTRSRFPATFQRNRSPEFSAMSRGSPTDGTNRSPRDCFPPLESASGTKPNSRIRVLQIPRSSLFPARDAKETNAPPATYGERRFVQWNRRRGHREICDRSGSFDKFLETPWSSARAPQCIEGVNSYRY